MRRCTSQNASTILDGAPELDTLPEDGQSSSYTWLDGFSKTEASPDLSFSTVTLPTSNSSSTPDSFATSPRPRRQSSFGSIKRRSIRSPNHSNLKTSLNLYQILYLLHLHLFKSLRLKFSPLMKLFKILGKIACWKVQCLLLF